MTRSKPLKVLPPAVTVCRKLSNAYWIGRLQSIAAGKESSSASTALVFESSESHALITSLPLVLDGSGHNPGPCVFTEAASTVPAKNLPAEKSNILKTKFAAALDRDIHIEAARASPRRASALAR